MANKRDEELEQLKKLSPYSLPDNPSQSGWTTKQVKGKFYQGLFYLYDLIDGERTDIEDVQNTLANLNLDDFVTEDEAQEIKNEAMPYVGETPPDVTKTKIWFDTTNDGDVIDIEDVADEQDTMEEANNEPFEEMFETQNNYQEPEIFNEYFEPLSFDNNNDNLSFENNDEDNLSFDEQEEVSFGEDDSNETLDFEN